MKDYNDYIHFKWNGKKYRWDKTRLFVLCVIMMILITTLACLHVHLVCKQNVPAYDRIEAAKAHKYEQEKIQSIVEHVNQTVKTTKTETPTSENEMPLYSTSSVKRYMDRRAVTDSSTKNYEICRNASVNKDGTLDYNGRTVIAIGQKYGKPGTKLDITLKNDEGKEHLVKAIIGDAKKYADTQNGAGWVAADGSVLEIVVDTASINQTSKLMGDMNYTPALNGVIVKIVKP